MYIRSYSLTNRLICLFSDDIFYLYTSPNILYLLFSYFVENPGTCLRRLRKIMRNFRQDSLPTWLQHCIHLHGVVLWIHSCMSCTSTCPGKYMYVWHMFPSTTTQFISLVTTSYMFQSYWPPPGIKYMIWKHKKWLYTKKMQIQILKINFTYKHKVLESRQQTK